MQVPQRQHVVSMPRHIVEKLAPEIEAPHFGDVGLRGVAVIGVARRAEVERRVEFDAAPLDTRGVIRIGERVPSVPRRMASARSSPPYIAPAASAPEDGDGRAAVRVGAADRVRLRRAVFSGATPRPEEIRCEAADPAAMTKRSAAESDASASSECSTSGESFGRVSASGSRLRRTPPVRMPDRRRGPPAARSQCLPTKGPRKYCQSISSKATLR